MKCRNYDCTKELGRFEIEKMDKLTHPLQSKYNYCVKCRRVDVMINRIQCHYCETFLSYTTLQTAHICDECRVERLKTSLYNIRTAPTRLITKQAKLKELLTNGVYTKAQLIDILDTTPYSLKIMLIILKKECDTLEWGYTIKEKNML